MIFSENRYTLFGIMLYAATRLRVHPRLAVIFTLGRAAACDAPLVGGASLTQ